MYGLYLSIQLWSLITTERLQNKHQSLSDVKLNVATVEKLSRQVFCNDGAYIYIYIRTNWTPSQRSASQMLKLTDIHVYYCYYLR